MSKKNVPVGETFDVANALLFILVEKELIKNR